MGGLWGAGVLKGHYILTREWLDVTSIEKLKQKIGKERAHLSLSVNTQDLP